MIINPENTNEPSKKEQEALQERKKAEKENRDDLPPDYASVLQDGAAALAISPPQAMVPPKPPSRNLPLIKASNFVHLSRQNSKVEGVYIIDSSMVIPSAFLPPLRRGQTEDQRENLCLQTSNGKLDAEVYILPTSTAAPDNNSAVVNIKAPRRPVVIRGRTDNGRMTMIFHEVPPSAGMVKETRPPCHIDCYTANGGVDIQIPRSFKGPISITTRNGSVRFSDAVKPLLTHFSEMDGAQRSFLGDFDPKSWGHKSEWDGDMLKVESRNGSVKISFDDERDEPKYHSSKYYSASSSISNSRSQGGLFGRLFGSS